jgi:hypothetical protein
VLSSWESPFASCLSALPVATTSVARSCTAGEHPLRILRPWVSPPADRSRSPERYQTGDAVRHRHCDGCRPCRTHRPTATPLNCEEATSTAGKRLLMPRAGRWLGARRATSRAAQAPLAGASAPSAPRRAASSARQPARSLAEAASYIRPRPARGWPAPRCSWGDPCLVTTCAGWYCAPQQRRSARIALVILVGLLMTTATGRADRRPA